MEDGGMNNSKLYEIAQALDPLLPGWSLNWDPVNQPRYALVTNMREPGYMSNWIAARTPPASWSPGAIAYGCLVPGIHPFYPRPENRVRITVSSARPIADIAADVQRRFVPRYLEAYTQVRERQRRAEEANRQEATILAELAAILDERVSDDEVIRYSSDRDGHYVYGRVEVARNRVKIDLSGLPVATAREICRLLREIK